jgi:hypothetical protein
MYWLNGYYRLAGLIGVMVQWHYGQATENAPLLDFPDQCEGRPVAQVGVLFECTWHGLT